MTHRYRFILAATAICLALVTLADHAGALEVRQVTRPTPFTLGGLNLTAYATPVWSVDGQSLVAAASGFWDFGPCPVPCYEHVSMLVAVDLNGNVVETFWGDREASRPSPDPTHTRFAFSCYMHLYCYGVCVIDASASGAPLACFLGESPAWSPDGLNIAMETDSGLQLFAPSGGSGIPLTTRADDRTPAWSPDGNAIVFSSTHGGARDLWILDVTSGVTRQLTADAAFDEWPAWSPGGAWIAFASDRDGTQRIWAIPSTGGTPVLVVDQPGSSAPAWSPNGQALAFHSGNQIWVATGLSDVLVSVESKSWGNIKTLYRGNR